MINAIAVRRVVKFILPTLFTGGSVGGQCPPYVRVALRYRSKKPVTVKAKYVLTAIMIFAVTKETR